VTRGRIAIEVRAIPGLKGETWGTRHPAVDDKEWSGFVGHGVFVPFQKLEAVYLIGFPCPNHQALMNFQWM
jgi:hypothetical protein